MKIDKEIDKKYKAELGLFADHIRSFLIEEIEKELLTFEEVKMCLRAVTETPPEGIKRDEPEFLVAVLRVVAQAQLNKILALFGKERSMEKGETQLLDMIEYWVKQCSDSEACQDCQYATICRAVYDSLIDNPETKLRAQYGNANKKQKTIMLDTFARIMGCSRRTAKYKLKGT